MTEYRTFSHNAFTSFSVNVSPPRSRSIWSSSFAISKDILTLSPWIHTTHCSKLTPHVAECAECRRCLLILKFPDIHTTRRWAISSTCSWLPRCLALEGGQILHVELRRICTRDILAATCIRENYRAKRTYAQYRIVPYPESRTLSVIARSFHCVTDRGRRIDWEVGVVIAIRNH